MAYNSSKHISAFIVVERKTVKSLFNKITNISGNTFSVCRHVKPTTVQFILQAVLFQSAISSDTGGSRGPNFILYMST